MNIKQLLRRGLRRVGYDISRFEHVSHSLARRKKLFETYKIGLVIDVGANRGQYALELRRDLRYSGQIVSFEPLTDAFRILQKYAESDSTWTAVNCALGERDELTLINVTMNSFSSSILNVLPRHKRAAPESRIIDKQEISVKALDSVFKEYYDGENVYLKIDTQGFEEQVLLGGKASLAKIDTVQLEMSLTSLYEGQASFGSLFKHLSETGYQLVAVEPGFSDPETGELLQVDGIFHKPN